MIDARDINIVLKLDSRLHARFSVLSGALERYLTRSLSRSLLTSIRYEGAGETARDMEMELETRRYRCQLRRIPR